MNAFLQGRTENIVLVPRTSNKETIPVNLQVEGVEYQVYEKEYE